MIYAKGPQKDELIPISMDLSRLERIQLPIDGMYIHYDKKSNVLENIEFQGKILYGIVYFECEKDDFELLKKIVDGYSLKWWRVNLKDLDKTYIENTIIPMYSSFDSAHDEKHVRAVMKDSTLLAQELGVNPALCYVAAAFHDIGLINGRDNHHTDSANLLRENAWIKANFTAEEITLLANACEDHRASSEKEPRSIFGLILADSDRQLDPDKVISRTIRFSLFKAPGSKESIFNNAMQHLNTKYSSTGYLKLFLPTRNSKEKLNQLRSLITSPALLREKFNQLYDDITKPSA